MLAMPSGGIMLGIAIMVVVLLDVARARDEPAEMRIARNDSVTKEYPWLAADSGHSSRDVTFLNALHFLFAIHEA